jgi:carbamoyl-phosphate synthase large subunit
MKNKRIFISGGNGVIGNELVKLLHHAGAELFVGDLKPRPLEWPKEIKYRQGDLNYLSKEEIEDFAPEVFIHLAATFEQSVETYEFWEENYQHNVRLSHHLVTLQKDLSSLKKIVFASSYLIYSPEQYLFSSPQHSPVSLSESGNIYPRNLTGVAKLNHEIELRFVEEFKAKQIQIVSARIYRSFGLNSRDVISRWVRSLIKGEEIFVWGEESFFDYIFARDVAKGLVKLTEIQCHEKIVNLGSGRSRKVLDVVQVLKNNFPNAKINYKKHEGQYEASQADMSLFKKITNWLPEETLETAIPQIIQYEKNKLNKDQAEAQSNVLITSISKKVPLIKSVKKATQKYATNIKVFGGDLNKDCIGSYFVDQFWQMPRLNSLTIEEVITFCRNNGIKAIIPTRDAELEFWALNKEKLKNNNIFVMGANIEITKICLDKLSFYESLNAKNIPVIPTYTSAQQVKSEKVVVKERFGAGSISIGINMTKSEAEKHALQLQNPIFQPYVEGEEVSVDSYLDFNNQIKGIVLRKRELVIGGESQITTTFRDSKLEELVFDVLKKVPVTGHSVMQIMKDKSQNYHIIEINSRFGGASSLSLESGLDSFYWFLLEANGADIREYPFFRSRFNKKQVRYPSDIVLNDSSI